ncbi:DUF3592 domain-containing protein [Microbacterium protaetiae]|uniref:DUF3592 domain-containing protein n=1 Tax=Microbacterium protaetiae TaxID=2509458 RepID=A0A4P6EFS0_9MICO|nr:DUF3592 domain-containing protein [Microbacterium protaetiae]QAY60686.1 DUF3592 domain-containing protein [Microbacterium protaetiae]
MTATAPARPRARSSALAIAAVVFLALIAGLIGGVLIALSQVDYTGYTERTTATVTDIVTKTGGGTGHHGVTTHTYYLDFEADGQTFTHERLQGVTTGTVQIGDTIELAYPPGQPHKAVTVDTTHASTSLFELLFGIGLLVLGAGGLLAALLWAVRSHRKKRLSAEVTSDAALVAPPTPIDPRLLPVPWPWEQVVAHLAHAAEDQPFSVAPRADGSVEVTHAVADARWFTLLRAHDLTSTFVCRLHPRSPGRYARTDTLYDVEWAAGVGGLRATGRVQAGRVWSFQRRVDYGFGADGAFGRQVDVTFSSSDVPRWIDAALSSSGWKSALDAQSRWGLVGVGIGGVAVVVAVILAILTAI